MYAKRCDCRYEVEKKFHLNDLAGNDLSVNILISKVIIYDVLTVEFQHL